MNKITLENRVIVFCGGIGVGKTTCVNILTEFLVKNKQSVVRINPFEDLYLPFIKRQGYSFPIKKTREEISVLMQSLYRQYGRNLGSKLLIELIKKNNNVVYILDGKRNSEGIDYLKQVLGDGCLVIGVISDLKSRKKRINKRARDIDINSLKQNAFALIKNEELVYNVSRSIRLSDFVICNSNITRDRLRRMLKPLSERFLLRKTEEDIYIKAFWEKLLITYKNTLPKRFSDLNETIFINLINIIINNQFNPKLVIILSQNKIVFCSKKNEISLRKEISFVRFMLKEKDKNNIFLLGLIQFYKMHKVRLFPSLGLEGFVSTEPHFESINECEVKFPLTLAIKKRIETFIAKKVIQYRGDIVLEDDLVVDTNMHDLKKLGILLRFRMFNKSEPTLLTIKFKKERGLIKQDIELQKTVLEENKSFLSLVNDFLQALNLSKINFENIINAKNSDDVARYFEHMIYSRVRMRIQKKRQIFRLKENETICMDELPKDIGKFVEIESDSLENVQRIIRTIGLDTRSVIKEDYGEIVKTYNKLHNIKDERVAKFDQ